MVQFLGGYRLRGREQVVTVIFLSAQALIRIAHQHRSTRPHKPDVDVYCQPL